MVIALGANIERFFHFRLIQNRITLNTFFPQTFRHFVAALGISAGNTRNNFI
jgi:hypothetical protein